MSFSDPFSILRSFPAFHCSRSFVFLNHNDDILLCSWKNAEIYIHTRANDQSYSAAQVLKTDHAIIAVLNVRNTVICVDSKGHLYKIVHDKAVEDRTNVEMHGSCAISPASPILGSGKLQEEPNKVTFRLAELVTLLDCEEVFYASFVQETEQLVFLTNMSNRLFFVAYNSSMKVSFITKIPYSIAEINLKNSIIKSCHSKLIDSQLKNVLFPALEAPAFIEFVVLIIALSNGSVLWITSNNSCTGLQFLHKCQQSLAAVTFFSIGDSKSLNTLCLILEGGPVLLLSSVDKKLSIHTQFLPSAAKAVYCKSDGSILSSDFSDCFYSTYHKPGKNVDFKTCSVLVKGIVKFNESLDEADTVIALTKQNLAYKIFIKNIEPLKISERFSIPRKGLLNDGLKTSKALDNLLKQIKEEDEKLTAISLTTRAAILHEFFNVSVKVYSGPAAVKYGSTSLSPESHALIIKIENKCSFYEFSPKLWHISVSLFLDSEMSTSVHRIINLKHSFKLNSEVIIHFPVSLKSILQDINLKVALVSKQSYQNAPCPWLIIPLKSIPLNLVYFLTPLKNPISSNLDATSLSIEEYLKKLSASNNALSEKIEERTIAQSCHLSYLIKLPQRILETHNIFGLVLNYSKYRCKENVWNSITDNSKSICFASLFEKLIQLSLEKDCLRLQISGVDVQFFHAIKLAFIKLLSSLFADDFILLKRSFLIDVQGSLHALEITQVSEDSNLNAFQGIREKLRSTIDVNLPP